MPLCRIITFKSFEPVGTEEMHFGFLCTVGEGGILTAEVPEEFMASELAAGRVAPIEPAPADTAPAKRTRKAAE